MLELTIDAPKIQPQAILQRIGSSESCSSGRISGANLSLDTKLEIMNEDSKDEHVKTVYAHFGLAQYLAQVLEHGLANALMYAELLPRRAGKPVPRKQWEAEFDGFMNQQFEQTLGRLIRGLGKATSVPTGLEGLLTRNVSMGLRHRLH